MTYALVTAFVKNLSRFGPEHFELMLFTTRNDSTSCILFIALYWTNIGVFIVYSYPHSFPDATNLGTTSHLCFSRRRQMAYILSGGNPGGQLGAT